MLSVASLVGWFLVKRPGQHFFSHVGTEPPLPVYLPVASFVPHVINPAVS